MKFTQLHSRLMPINTNDAFFEYSQNPIESIKEELVLNNIDFKSLELEGNKSVLLISLVANSAQQQKQPVVFINNIASNKDEISTQVENNVYLMMQILALCKVKDIERKRDVHLLITYQNKTADKILNESFLLNDDISKILSNAYVIKNNSHALQNINCSDIAFYENGQKSNVVISFKVKALKANGRYLPSGDGVCRAMKLVDVINEKFIDDKETFFGNIQVDSQFKNVATLTTIKGDSVNEIEIIFKLSLLPKYDEQALRNVLEQIEEEFVCKYDIISFEQGCNSKNSELDDIIKNAISSKAQNVAQVVSLLSINTKQISELLKLNCKVYAYSPQNPLSENSDTKNIINEDIFNTGRTVFEEIMVNVVQ